LERWPISNFRIVDRKTGFLLPPSVNDWLPEPHLARFVVEVIEELEFSAMGECDRALVPPATIRCCCSLPQDQSERLLARHIPTIRVATRA